jgi:hypothetical protein
MAVHIGQAIVSAGVAIGKFFVVKAHEVKNGGVHVVNVDAVLHELDMAGSRTQPK